jgi:hypothetical protein
MATAVVVHTFDRIPTSRQSVGAFDCTDCSVEFRIVKWSGTPGVVAFCIEHSRLYDLLEGEKARGRCIIFIWRPRMRHERLVDVMQLWTSNAGFNSNCQAAAWQFEAACAVLPF